MKKIVGIVLSVAICAPSIQAAQQTQTPVAHTPARTNKTDAASLREKLQALLPSKAQLRRAVPNVGVTTFYITLLAMLTTDLEEKHTNSLSFDDGYGIMKDAREYANKIESGLKSFRENQKVTYKALVTLLLAGPLAQAFHDRNLSSAQLAQKNWFRRWAGWLLRHRVTPFFGAHRGSDKNTTMLLNEYAALPADATEATKELYRSELAEARAYYDADTEMSARIAKALAA